MEMHGLERGIHRLDEAHFTNSSSDLFGSSDGAATRVLIVTCSDLDTDPFTLFGDKRLKLAVLQNAGNVVEPFAVADPTSSDAIESVLSRLPIDHIAVCGHLPCGVLESMSDEASGSRFPKLGRLLQETRSILREHYRALHRRFLHEVFAQENVLVQLEHLTTIPAVVSKLSDGTLRLHGLIYQDAELFAYFPSAEQFTPLGGRD
jgi:carbonic anhydrase